MIHLYAYERYHWSLLKIKMDNPTFVNEEDVPMVYQVEGYYDNYRTPDTSRVDEASFTVHNNAEPISTL